MRSNWWRWLWGIIPLLILGWIAVEAEHTRLETDLAARTSQALAAAKLGWASTNFQGRDGVLTGRASDVSDPDKAMSLLTRVWGVRVIDNRSDLIEKVENYVWAASRRNNRVRLTGYVPNVTSRQLILGMARANFPGFEIQDRMKLARGVPSVDPWLGTVSFGLKQLTLLKSGDVRLDGMSLIVLGEAEDTTAYRTLRSSLGSNLPKTIKLASSNIQAPLTSPHIWSVKYDGASMAFKGSVPTDTEQAAIMAAAREVLSEKAVTDDSEPGSGTPQGWSEAALLTVRQIRRLEHGTAEIKDGVLTISGLAPDDKTAEAVRTALKALPATIKFTDGLQVRPPPKPAEPPPAPLPQNEPTPQQAPPPPPRAEQPVPPAEAPKPEPKVERKAEQPKPEPKVEPKAEAKAEPKPEPQVAPKAEPKVERKVEAVPPPAPPPAVVPPPPPAPRAAAAPAVSPPPPPEKVQAAKACEDKLRELAAAGTILFRYGSVELSPSSTETLNQLATAARGCPEMIISIGGFASAEGALLLNQRLSLGRARSVLTYLVKAGVDVRQLEAKGYGIDRPVAPNTTLENMAKNRRIEFTVRPAAGEPKSGGR